MRAYLLIIVVLASIVATRPVQAQEGGACPYQGRELTQRSSAGGDLRDPTDELSRIISDHQEWLDKYSDHERLSFVAQTDPLRAQLCGAVLTKVSLFVSDLSFADLTRADLKGSFLNGANLHGSVLTGAQLQGATLVGADITGALLGEADLAGVRYEPKAGGLPHPIAIRRALNLELMIFKEHPDALFELRAAFRSAGRRDLERRITFAIERSRTTVAYEQHRYVEATFRKLAWELPTAYDLRPERALLLLLFLWIAFVPAYLVALWSPTGRKVWRVFPKDRIGGGEEVQEPVVARGWIRLWFAAYFSLLAVCRVGWKDLSIGTWLARLQCAEYDLRGVGWVRTIAGLQSLLGLYLLALWALTYFGRFFE